MDDKPNRWLQVIAVFKLCKAALLVLLAFGAFHLLHKDLADELEHWAKAARIDPENRYLVGLLAKANLVDARKLKELGGLTLAYAALFLTEGVGLWLRQRWAEYLTTIATASFIPLEIYELGRHPTVAKTILLVLNVAIVIYLIFTLRKNAKTSQP
jgi:uncharacterized membrane protein (DUF2068 family)